MPSCGALSARNLCCGEVTKVAGGNRIGSLNRPVSGAGMWSGVARALVLEAPRGVVRRKFPLFLSLVHAKAC
jgi:hypothetical protein